MILKKKERKGKTERNYLPKTFFLQIERAEFSLSLLSVKFINDFDDSINFHSVNFH